MCTIPVKSLIYKNDIIKYRLKQISSYKKSKLCFSADIEDPVKIIDILNKIGEHIVVCKIHYDIINLKEYDGDFISDLIDCSIKYDFLIMEDRKFIDISYIVEKQYAQFS